MEPTLILPAVEEVRDLIARLIPTIDDDYRSDGCDEPSMDLTIGCDTETGEWGYQTGDNSLSGSAYWYPTWGIVTLMRDSDPLEAAKRIIADIDENAPYVED